MEYTSFEDDDVTEEDVIRMRQIPAGSVAIRKPYKGSTVAGTQHGMIAGEPSKAAKKAADFGLQFVNDVAGTTAYHKGGGVQDTNPLLGEPPYKLDSPSFVYWCYHYAGVDITKGAAKPTPMTIRNARTLKTVGEIGSGIHPSNLTYGDIVFFSGDKHLGIYVGDGEFIGFNGTGYDNYEKGCEKKSMSLGYWSNNFEGHVMRY